MPSTAEVGRAPVELRDQYGTVADVNVRQRLIDLVVVPFNEETVVEYPPGSGRMIVESVLPGAFAGLDAVPQRVTVNRDHKAERAIGVARSVAESDEGLIATVKISSTPLGDETLTLAEDGVVQPSIGMGVRPKDQRWSDANGRRQIVRAFLDHIGLVTQQAYGGARVLAVRSVGAADPDGELWVPPARPLLDDVLAYVAKIDGELRSTRSS